MEMKGCNREVGKKKTCNIAGCVVLYYSSKLEQCVSFLPNICNFLGLSFYINVYSMKIREKIIHTTKKRQNSL